MKCERLDVWKRSCRVCVNIYTHLLPCKDFGFKDQITRSALSIGSNIAEGLEKESSKEKLRFLEIAQGSAAELITQIYIGIEIGYIERKIGIRWKQEVDEILKMLSGLKKNYRPT
jgi:four helix bundle protein